MTTVTLVPTGDTATGNPYPVLGIFPAAPATHFDKVQTNNGDTSFNFNDQGNSAECDMLTYPASGIPVGSTINSVAFHQVSKRVSIGAALAVLGYDRVWTHGVGYEYSHVLGVNYVDLVTVLAVNPNTGVAWTIAEIDAIIFGDRLGYSQNGARITWGQCTQVYIVVDYTAPVVSGDGKAFIGSGFYFGLP